MERHWNTAPSAILHKVIPALTLLLVTSCGIDSGSGDYEYSLPNGYFVFATSTHQVSILHKDLAFLEVPAKVVEIGWNEQFILARQQLLKKRGDFSGDDFQVPDVGKYQFWIIDLTGTNRIGPLNAQAFAEKKKELGVPSGIKLKKASAYVK